MAKRPSTPVEAQPEPLDQPARPDQPAQTDQPEQVTGPRELPLVALRETVIVAAPAVWATAIVGVARYTTPGLLVLVALAGSKAGAFGVTCTDPQPPK